MRSFVSTRGAGPVSFRVALFTGMAPDGGLWMPGSVPPLTGSPHPSLVGDFAGTAAWAATAMLGPIAPPEVLDAVVREALDFPVPLVEVEPGIHVLELFHGPTLAFKDVGARFMAGMMRALDPDPAQERTVLVATSGDTGSAVAHAFRGSGPTRVVVLFPEHGVSERQRRQMTTLGGNVSAVAVAGTFDDCQHMVKAAFADADLAAKARLTSANSINVGRLLPQALYYVHAAAALGWEAAPTFVVPSGNLGNLTGGLLAMRAGVQVSGFVAACNANRVFPDYLTTRILEARPSIPTLSNAMDVGDPSNLERIRWMYGGDVGALACDVRAVSVDDAWTRETIRQVHRRTGYVLDPHGAVAFAAALEHPRSRGPLVVLATAHPAKFPEVVEEATGVPVQVPERLAAVMDAPERVERIAAESAALRDLILEGVPS
jgi:threonine synthase